jgi:hypothetical protein
MEPKTLKVRPMGLIQGPNEGEVWILGASLLTGLIYLITNAPPPGSIEQKFDPWIAQIWYVNLSLGSALALIGGLVPRAPLDKPLVQGLRLYRAGLLYLGSACVFYSLAIFLTFRVGGIASGILIGGLGTGWLRRARRVRRTVKPAEGPKGGERDASDPGAE